jgi:hypothetical protein
VAGVAGAVLLVVSFLSWTWSKIVRAFTAQRKSRELDARAIRSLPILDRGEAQTLLFLVANDHRRFQADVTDGMLMDLRNKGVIREEPGNGAGRLTILAVADVV